MTGSGIRELEVVVEGAFDAPAAPDVVPDTRHSHTTLVIKC